MNRLFGIMVCLALSGAAVAQLAASEPQERMFFPKDTLSGWAQFQLAPPHNEVDPNICSANAGQYGGEMPPVRLLLVG